MCSFFPKQFPYFLQNLNMFTELFFSNLYFPLTVPIKKLLSLVKKDVFLAPRVSRGNLVQGSIELYLGPWQTSDGAFCKNS